MKELPISTIRLNSILYVLLKNKIKRCYSPKHIYGDGKSIGTSYNRCERIKMQWTKLMHPMVIAATMDGVMSGLLQRVYQSYRNEDNFVVIGHPKAFTDASLNNVANFLQKVNGEAIFDTISSLQIKNHL